MGLNLRKPLAEPPGYLYSEALSVLSNMMTQKRDGFDQGSQQGCWSWASVRLGTAGEFQRTCCSRPEGIK